MRPPNAAPFDPWPMTQEPDRLGPVTWEAITTQSRGVSGRVVSVATLSPRGLSEVVKSGWSFKRQVQAHDWANGDKQKGPKHPKSWARTWADDTSDKRYLRLIPDSDDKIYDSDAPDILITIRSFETYNNFRQWIEWNGDMCSDYAFWHWQACWKKYRNPDRQIRLCDLGTGLIRLPAHPYYRAAPLA